MNKASFQISTNIYINKTKLIEHSQQSKRRFWASIFFSFLLSVAWQSSIDTKGLTYTDITYQEVRETAPYADMARFMQ